MPPSPPVVIILSWQKDQAATCPIEPADLPLYFAPCACAQSSITYRPLSEASCMIGSMSHIQPARCTQIMALVLGVMTASMVRREIFWGYSSTSAKIGFAPAVTIELADARKVREVTITSSPAPIPNALSATSSATVP